ncbi:hypothetical protein ACOKM5_15565 [Streptomyces sp. BH097]|uniref:hypothetical protein n=1 Tax=unclassified Streptomyces TaxID=2593676 RepID=UPI003BB7891E
MSRETDSSSSGPQGRGAAAYPSGTPPYGSPAQGAASDDAGPTPPDGQGAPESPKTETTLTTRIRINIPGSRPIPPVVMRTPMSDVDANPRSGTGQGADAAPAPDPTQGGRPSAPASYSGPTDTGSAPAAPEASAPAAPAPQREEKTSDWFAPRKPRGGAGGPATGAVPTVGSGGPATGAGAPTPPAPGSNGGNPSGTSGGPLGGPTGGSGNGPTGGPSGGSSGGFDVSSAVAAGPLGSGGAPGARDDLPFFSANQDPGAPDRGEGPTGPVGPTSGPAAGDGPMVPPNAPNPPVPGAGQSPPRLSDDTAILTPQKPAPEPPTGGNSGNVSGDTLTSGMRVVPSAGGGPKKPGASDPFQQGPDGPAVHTPPKLPDPVPSAPAPKKKGRNKLVLLGAGVVGLAGVAYGAGLLMNHADVPKGTTVAGVDIGGGTRDEATTKLENALGKRTEQALKLQVGGKTVEMQPAQAGLSLDTASTVAAAAGSDYNPVSVIGSLFGNERVVAPVMPVDEEKLAASLQRAAGGAAASGEGTIKFAPGKAVPVYGKTGKGLDIAQSVAAVKDAYHAQVETGASGAVPLATSTHKPTISDAEVDRKMQQFAEPAMSGLITVKAGGASIQFGPDKSLPKILSVQPVNGKLVEKYNLPELKKLYGTTFDGVLVTRGTGKKTPVQPTDVAAAIGKALLGKTPAERTAEIQTNAS